MKKPYIYNLCVYIFHDKKWSFAFCFILSSISLIRGVEPFKTLSFIFFMSFIALVFLGALSYFWDTKVRIKPDMTSERMQNYLFNHANAGVEKPKESFWEYTMSKHGGWTFLMSTIIITGVIVASIDTHNDYKGGAWWFVAVATFVPSVAFFIDYKNNNK